MKYAILCIALVGLILTGCSSQGKFTGKEGQTVGVRASGIIKITQGGEQPFELQVDNAEYMKGPIHIALSDAPAGISIKEKDPMIRPGESSKVFTLVATAEAEPVEQEDIVLEGRAGEQVENIKAILTIRRNPTAQANEKNAFLKEMQAKRDAAKEKMTALQQHAVKVKDTDASQELNNTLKQLLKKLESVENRLSVLGGETSAQDWEGLRTRTEETVEEYVREVDRAQEKYMKAKE